MVTNYSDCRSSVGEGFVAGLVDVLRLAWHEWLVQVDFVPYEFYDSMEKPDLK